MENFMTARDARNKTNEVNGSEDKFDQLVKIIQDYINHACENGMYSCNVSISKEYACRFDDALELMRDVGYTVKKVFPTIAHISW